MGGIRLVCAVLGLAACGGAAATDIDGSVEGDAAGPIDAGTDAETTIYDIQTPGGVASKPGTSVTLGGVVVTAIDWFGDEIGDVYVQEPAGGAYSGVVVVQPAVGGGLGLEDVQVGDRVDLTGGEVEELNGSTRLVSRDGAPVTVTRTGGGAAPAPALVDPVLLASDPVEADKWEGVLITSSNVAVTAGAAGISGTDPSLAEMTITGPIRVQSSLTGVSNAWSRDSCLASLRGIGGAAILPRDPGDVVVAAEVSACPYENSSLECFNGFDDDHDGFADCDDFSCYVATGCTIEATVYDVQMGFVGEGAAVIIRDVVVSGVAISYFWVQDPAGGPYSGVAVGGYLTDFTALYDVGDVVTVEGRVYEQTFLDAGELTMIIGAGFTPPTITVTGSADPPVPAVVTSLEEEWEGVLVKLEDAYVIEPDVGLSFGEWIVGTSTDTVHVDSLMYSPYDEPPGPAAGTCFSELVGIVHYFVHYQLEPRSAADIGPPCL